MTNSGSPNRLESNLEPIPYFVKSLIAGLSVLIYVPAAEQITDLLKYVAGRIRFPDGTTVTYEGKPEMLKATLLPITIVIWAQILLGAMLDDGIVELAVSVAMGLAMGYVTFQFLQVVAAQFVTNHGSRLQFSATMDQYLKWQLVLIGCSAGPGLLRLMLPSHGFLATVAAMALGLLTLVLISLVMVPYLQWFVSKVTGGARLARFDANPIEMVGMYVGFVLFSMLIVTIPWSVVWFMKWLLSRYSLPARSVVATGTGYPV